MSKEKLVKLLVELIGEESSSKKEDVSDEDSGKSDLHHKVAKLESTINAMQSIIADMKNNQVGFDHAIKGITDQISHIKSALDAELFKATSSLTALMQSVVACHFNTAICRGLLSIGVTEVGHLAEKHEDEIDAIQSLNAPDKYMIKSWMQQNGVKFKEGAAPISVGGAILDDAGRSVLIKLGYAGKIRDNTLIDVGLCHAITQLSKKEFTILEGLIDTYPNNFDEFIVAPFKRLKKDLQITSLSSALLDVKKIGLPAKYANFVVNNYDYALFMTKYNLAFSDMSAEEYAQKTNLLSDLLPKRTSNALKKHKIITSDDFIAAMNAAENIYDSPMSYRGIGCSAKEVLTNAIELYRWQVAI